MWCCRCKCLILISRCCPNHPASPSNNLLYTTIKQHNIARIDYDGTIAILLHRCCNVSISLPNLAPYTYSYSSRNYRFDNPLLLIFWIWLEFGYLTPVLEIQMVGYRVEGKGGKGGYYIKGGLLQYIFLWVYLYYCIDVSVISIRISLAKYTDR